MSRTVISPPVPYVVAQRLRNLLHCFPSAAVGGVQWSTLMRKYQERHKLPLDLPALGHSSPLGAATALLWDVLRLVDSQDPSNPVVAFDDREVLTPRAASFAAWPSIYQALCGLVEEAEAEQGRSKGEEQDAIPGVPLSRLRSLLRLNWHKRFGEDGLTYLTEEGCAVKLESMEDLVEAVLMWREERAIWRSATDARYGALDEVICPELDLAPLGPWGELHLCRARPQRPQPCAPVTPPRRLIRRLSTVKFAGATLGEAEVISPGVASTAPSEGDAEDSGAQAPDLASERHSPAEAQAEEEEEEEGEEEEEEEEEAQEEEEEERVPQEEGATPFKEAAAARRAARPFARSATMPVALDDGVQIPSGAVQHVRSLFESKTGRIMPSFFTPR